MSFTNNHTLNLKFHHTSPFLLPLLSGSSSVTSRVLPPYRSRLISLNQTRCQALKAARQNPLQMNLPPKRSKVGTKTSYYYGSSRSCLHRSNLKMQRKL